MRMNRAQPQSAKAGGTQEAYQGPNREYLAGRGGAGNMIHSLASNKNSTQSVQTLQGSTNSGAIAHANKHLQQMVGLVKPGQPSLAAVYVNDPTALDASQLERVFVNDAQQKM